MLVPANALVMSVTSFLRMRLGGRYSAAQIVQKRALSGADAVNALRPFYFAVHPDFFGQHPREREVNENSLKRLNAYLESLQKPGMRSLKPTMLTFYVRDTKEKIESECDLLPTGFRSVTLTLRSKDVLSTVVDILKSCSLSVEHMQELLRARADSKNPPQPGGTPFYRPIKWDRTYYSFTGFRDPEQELEQAKKVETTLSQWLTNNEPDATKKQNASMPRRAELKRLKGELMEKLGLLDIRWQRKWGVAHRCCQLQSLSRLYSQSPEAMLNLRGYIIVFTDQSGMNAAGHVMLGTMDVHHQWTKLFHRLPSYCSLLQQTVWLKDRIGLLLGGIQVMHMERGVAILPLEEHYSTLSTFHRRLLPHRLALHPRSLQGLTMTLENDRSTPTLHAMGHFIVPTICDLAQLQSFLQSHAAEARARCLHKDQLEAEEEDVVSSCMLGLSLRSLSKEPSVSSSQMIPCCTRLMEERWPHMQGLHLRISHFYSVMQDGDLCIPWDWKG
ncbi:T-cell activation inhibitor, mitochondrial isoform X1 [Electrophorus electricus]|nr:T-cell activation inhibitor, mitochondrial isoform X1 [Electrophorus electricus]XP_026888267.2 T-cell activation inhibitor, mitochondrial isoform X1 [Electrophorus electricus]XP_026888268.2 T-cell activation inhibitor, mitochondrial isoform X1 [Electrophorus electricus]XP_026888269.2 T-cell activation inhibitor, mitochondrial isoform X1 [Electrophorus electricus]